MSLCLDGGLGTELQKRGLPPGVPADDWVLSHPDAVRAVHRSFVDAGAVRICTATLSVPRRGIDGGLLRRAVELAREAGAPEVWLSLGPGEGHDAAVEWVDVDGVVLETFVDPAEAMQAARRVRSVYAGPLAVCVVPGSATSSLTGVSLVGFADAVRLLGARPGFNCASGAVMVDALPVLGTGPVWLKPNADTTCGTEALRLNGPDVWLGGCCGTGPDELRAWGS